MKTSPNILHCKRTISENHLHQKHLMYRCWRINGKLTWMELYQRGPRGGGMSIAIKPLMHWAVGPSPTFIMYWWHHPEKFDIRYNDILVIYWWSLPRYYHHLYIMTVARQKPGRIFILNNSWYQLQSLLTQWLRRKKKSERGQFKVIECFSLFGSLVLLCSLLDTDDQMMSKMQTKKQLKKISLKLQGHLLPLQETFPFRIYSQWDNFFL